VLESVEVPEEDVDADDDENGVPREAVTRVVWTVDDVGTGITGVPVSETILETPLREAVGTTMLDGSVDDIEVAAVVNTVTERWFVDVIVMVIVPIVSAIALDIPEQMLYTLVSSTASLLGQLETRHSSAASPIVNPDEVLWVHRHVRSRSLEHLEA
jgi:hypothetical protein